MPLTAIYLVLLDGAGKVVSLIEFYLFWSCKPDRYAVIGIAEKVAEFLRLCMIDGGAAGLDSGAAANETYVISNSLLGLELLPVDWRRGG